MDTSKAINAVEPFDYVIFGATGDLTMRKLLPAFYYRMLAGQVPDSARIIGTARSPLSRTEYQGRAREALDKFVAKADLDEARVEAFLNMLYYVSLNGADPEGKWADLKASLAGGEGKARVFYFSTAPNLYRAVAENLHAQELITPKTRVVLEKPIGIDQESAREINDGVGRYFQEGQIFRIDHYLGKETVQDIIALRFANPVLNAVWSAEYIDYVQITAAETVGVEGRAGYYDGSGALRDMIQNHLLQVLSVVAMEKPASLDADAVRDAKVKVLQALKPLTAEMVKDHAVRAQYVAGESGGKEVPGYLTELGHESGTETFAAVRAEIATPRWAGVPFYIRSAKRLTRKVSEVVIAFKKTDHGLFPEGDRPQVLVIRIQPDEGVSLSIEAKDPSRDDMALREATLDVSFGPTFKVRYPDAYERLLLDAVRGYPVLFIRRDEVEAAWSWVEPVLESWKANKAPVETYKAGSWGPEAAKALLARDGHAWHEDMA
ncbi:glucose-6-phosphate dehydrogenase [Tanticharoenia sakaeratensis]|uniref:Glucose-6-phosphate 1-dehydrogenase n=1 Tax=Tanticharoenia sakaeratensis NBRC 103193 TaxID=1231623 RepID=A0A0D6MPA1_9PROT|nr:glucose-6-phosphate dehydrogenase [Tanticharoenia sakaeratensis]GAN55123.1 glucose-6-phosphate 1-dehydrogenase [Tanticharoenia sakaeratensis NBRC 103193]GBQ20284.1 glucose-6-phosphate 1-dehydrogenase [Tanticharoenia sakaeratensis NBRC 103193]